MVRIYLETGGNTTPEYVFVNTLMKHWGYDANLFEIVRVGGKDKLPLMEAKMKETTLEGGKNLVIFDADSPENGGGFNVRKDALLQQLQSMGAIAELFLFPNNHDDGDIEVLLETLTRKDLHERFFDCFNDYERCLGTEYNTPDLKAKLYAYMTSQKGLSKTKLNKVKSGQWLFEDKNYWDIDRDTLTPLKDFILKAF